MKYVPNIISVFRICLVPVFIIAYFTEPGELKLAAVAVYVVAAFSDFLDGFIARRFQATSSLGKVLDPLGDKLMTISVMACITIDGLIPIWAIIVAVTKELLMAVGGLVLHKVAGVEILPSNIIGKTSTVVFFVVFITLILFRDIPRGVAIGMISFAIGLTFVALISYFSRYHKVMKNRHIS